MRISRIKPPRDTREVSFFHCVSRIVNRSFVIQEEEKEFLVKWMRKYEQMCEVRVVTFCFLDNHIHILLEVPPKPLVELSDEELLERLASASRKVVVTETKMLLERLRADGKKEEAEKLRDRIKARMWDVSQFMKQLKQQFTQWFNKKHGRCGTLWEDRFKSVLVEGSGLALATMAAYIDLNPVRAGIVEDPKDYRWSGYGQAVAGRKEAIRGLAVVSQFFGMQGDKKSEVLKRYRLWVYEEGQERLPDPASGSKGRRGIKADKVEKVVDCGGKLGRVELLRVKVRYFLDGAILGSRGFVEGILEARREDLALKRKTGATRMKGQWGGLCTLRALRVNVFG